MSKWTRLKSSVMRTSLAEALKDAKNTDFTTLGQSIAFSVVVAFFPGVVALVSLYRTFADQNDVSSLLVKSAEVLPGPMQSLLSEQIRELTAASPEALGLGLVFGLATALWAVSSAMQSIVLAIDTSYDVTEERGFIKARLHALAIASVTVCGAVLATYLITRLPNVWGLRSLAAGLVAFVWLVSVYRYAPNRDCPSWVHVLPGAVLTAAASFVGTLLMSWYVANFADYNRTYGVLGGVMVALLWLNVSAVILIVGAELNAVVEARHTGTSSSAAKSDS